MTSAVGGGEVVQYGHFSDNVGFFRCGRHSIWRKKISDFSKFIVCLHGQGEGGEGWANADIFRTKKEGAIFFGTVLRTAPKIEWLIVSKVEEKSRKTF